MYYLMMIILPLLVAVFYAVVAAKNPSLASKSLKTGGMGLLKAMPILIAGFAIAGLVQAMEMREFVTQWLGSQSGFKGLLVATSLGVVTPGPVFFVLPVAGGLLKAGAGPGLVVAFIVAWDGCSIRRVVMDLAMIDWRIVLLKFILSLLFAIAAGMIAGTVFSKTVFS